MKILIHTSVSINYNLRYWEERTVLQEYDKEIVTEQKC